MEWGDDIKVVDDATSSAEVKHGRHKMSGRENEDKTRKIFEH